jgi:hypothetical protein
MKSTTCRSSSWRWGDHVSAVALRCAVGTAVWDARNEGRSQSMLVVYKPLGSAGTQRIGRSCLSSWTDGRFRGYKGSTRARISSGTTFFFPRDSPIKGEGDYRLE